MARVLTKFEEVIEPLEILSTFPRRIPLTYMNVVPMGQPPTMTSF